MALLLGGALLQLGLGLLLIIFKAPLGPRLSDFVASHCGDIRVVMLLRCYHSSLVEDIDGELSVC